MSSVWSFAHRIYGAGQYLPVEIIQLPLPAFDEYVSSVLRLPESLKMTLKCLHVAHFVFRRIEECIQVQQNHYASYVGLALSHYQQAPFVQVAVKAAHLGRILLQIQGQVRVMGSAFDRLKNEVMGKLPAAHAFLQEESLKNDEIFDLPWSTEVNRLLPKIFALVAFRLRWIVIRLLELIQALLTLSSQLLDLYDAIVYASTSWECFQLLPNLEKIIGSLESEPKIFARFVSDNKSVFLNACSLLKVQGLGEQILSLLESGSEILSQTARSIKCVGRFTLSSRSDIEAYVGNTGIL